MKQLLNNTALRELPEYLIDDYIAGRVSDNERKLVEALINLPVNREKFKRAQETTPSEVSEERIARLMKAASNNPVPHPSEKDDITVTSGDVKVEAGQIWSIQQFLEGVKRNKEFLPIAQTQYVFILTNPTSLSEMMPEEKAGLKLHIDDEFVEYLPVSLHTEFANQHDMIIPEGNPILGVEFMIETEINSTTLCKNLEECFGKLPEEDAEQLLNLYFFTHKMGHDNVLLGETETGTHRYDADSIIVDYKKIEFENSQIISEPVDDMRGYLEAIPRVRMAMDEYTNQFKKLAASTKEINVARLVPVTSEILHGDNNISVAINRYEEVGYYFNVVVASEVCPDTFRFIVSNRADVSKSLVLAGNKPGEHFFSFYKEFSSGIYDVTIETEAGVILSSEFMIELEAE